MPRKEDRRKIRTRKQLAQAILQLLEEKEYEQITVQNITESADLNRATFYLHYTNKDELLFAALAARFDELVAQIDDHVVEGDYWEDNTDMLLTFQHVQKHAKLYKIVLGSNGMGFVMHGIMTYIADVGLRHAKLAFPQYDGPTMPVELMSRHVAGSMLAVLIWWLENDCQHSAQYMADVTHQLCKNGTLPIMLGHSPPFMAQPEQK